MTTAFSIAGNAKVEILSGAKDAKGRPSELIVHFTIIPGWHMYWTNPGETGMAPQFDWKMPAGASADLPRFPIPHKIITLEGLTSYGYENELTVFIPLKYVSAEPLKEKISVSVTSMICQENCVTETGKIEIDPANLKVADEQQLKKWGSQLPVQTKKITSEVKLDQDQKSGVLSVRINPTMRDPELFPPDADFLKYSPAEQVKNVDGTESLQIKFRVLAGVKKEISGNAEAILAYTDSKGNRRGLSFRPDFGFKD